MALRRTIPRSLSCRPPAPIWSPPPSASSRSARAAGLRVLAALEPTILAIADATRLADADDLGGGRSAPTSPPCGTKPNTRGCSAHDHISQRPSARRRRRPGRHRQDRADGCAVQALARHDTRSRRSPTTSTPRKMRNSSPAPARCRPNASWASRPAAARTPPFARMPASTSPASPICNGDFPALELILIESGGDNLAATFSPELADLTIYVIDVSAGDKIPRKGGPGITKQRPSGDQQDRPCPDGRRQPGGDGPRRQTMRGDRPFIFANVKAGKGTQEIARFIAESGGLTWRADDQG